MPPKLASQDAEEMKQQLLNSTCECTGPVRAPLKLSAFSEPPVLVSTQEAPLAEIAANLPQ